MHRRSFLFRLAAASAGTIFAGKAAGAAEPGDTWVLIIRHAEKPEGGDGLTPAGEARAQAYIPYFRSLQVEGHSLTPNVIFASADSAHSRRPRLTVEPLAQALGLRVDTRFKAKEVTGLADEIRAHGPGRNILVCWHHGDIPTLLAALGVNSGEPLLPARGWPREQYDWLLELRLDAQGQLQGARRVEEGLTGSR